MDLKNKNIIVLGFPRSGTGYIAKYLQAYEFDVGHEKLGKNGTSDWRLVPGYTKKNNDFLIHVVRYPLNVIASNAYTARMESMEIIRKTCDSPPTTILQVIINGCIWWNDTITTYKPDIVINVEQTSEQFKLEGLKGDLPPTNYNTRPHPKIEWWHLERLKNYTLTRLKKMMKEQGYGIPEDKLT